jgi:hypothetical protein
MDLEGTIEDAVNDSIADTSTSVDSPAVADNSPDVSTDDAPVADESSAVPSPASAADAAAEDIADEFAKKFGLQSQSVTGRENRIPYSRVKKIVTKAELEAKTAAQKEFDTQFQPKLQEFETKVKDYEGRLEKVAQFEHILDNDPKQFLNMLSGHPAYKEFFEYVSGLVQGGTKEEAAPQQYLDNSTMPQPDVTLADGSQVYSLEGLSKRDEWLARQVEDRAVKAAEQRVAQRYAPIEQEWQAQQRIQQTVPIIQKQIAEARTWDRFTDLEPRIIEVLKADPNISLDRAYLKVYQSDVVPKLQTNRDDMRKSILEELKKQPVSGAPISGTKPNPAPTGPRSLEQIIADEVQAKLR